MKGAVLPVLLAAFLAAPIGATPGPATEPRGPALDREVRDARAYLEGWFGAPIPEPPIEVLSDEGSNRADAPGHFEGGVIRLRSSALRRESELRRVLRHELAHAAVDQRTKGNCPVWVQEGVAQFLDGTNVLDLERALRRDHRPLAPLLRLEGPLAFTQSGEAAKEQAYRQSASAVSFLASRIGRAGLLFLIDRLGEGRPFDRALLEAGLSYAELQQAWEASLRRPATRSR